MWDRLEPSAAPVEALYGALLVRARDEAVRCVNQAISMNAVTPKATRAAEYLGAYHKILAQQLFQGKKR